MQSLLKELKRCKDNRGVVLIEFAIVIPLATLLIFATVELVRVLQVLEVATVVSREAASAVFTETSLAETDYADSENQLVVFRNDLRIVKLLQRDLNVMAPGGEIVVSRYFLQGGAVQSRSVAAKDLFEVGSAEKTTRFKISGASVSDGKFSVQLSAGKPFLVIAEVYVPCPEILVPGIASMVGIKDGVYYAATII